MQGGYALTALAARIVNHSPPVQQEANNVCRQGMCISPQSCRQTFPQCVPAAPLPLLTQMPIVAGLVQGSPATVVPGAQRVAL